MIFVFLNFIFTFMHFPFLSTSVVYDTQIFSARVPPPSPLYWTNHLANIMQTFPFLRPPSSVVLLYSYLVSVLFSLHHCQIMVSRQRRLPPTPSFTTQPRPAQLCPSAQARPVSQCGQLTHFFQSPLASVSSQGSIQVPAFARVPFWCKYSVVIIAVPSDSLTFSPLPLPALSFP